MPLKETDSHAKWSAALLVSNTLFILIRYTHSILLQDSPLWSLVLTQTIANNTDARRCNPSPSPLVLTLLNMHTHFKVRIPQVSLIPRHQPFISPFTKLLGQVAGVAEKKFQQLAKFFSSRPLHLSIYFSSPCPINSSGPSQPSLHHHFLSSSRSCSFHLPSLIQLHPSPSFAPPLSCTP